MATNFANLFNLADSRSKMYVGWVCNLPLFDQSPLPPIMVGKIERWGFPEDTFELNWNQIELRQQNYPNEIYSVYPAVGPKAPYPQPFTDHPAIDCRIIPWIDWKYSLQFMYWQACYYDQVGNNVWTDPLTYDVGGTTFANGDGVLIYPGALQGLLEPQPSLRLELIREGFEDYEYLYLLASLGEKNYVENECDMLFTKFADITRDEDKLYQARENIANKILELLYPTIPPTTHIDNSSNDNQMVNTTVGPNPFIPSQGLGNENDGITFYNLTTSSVIKIITLNGNLIVTLKNPSSTGKIKWDTRDSNSKLVKSGIYLCYIQDSQGNKKMFKVAIIR